MRELKVTVVDDDIVRLRRLVSMSELWERGQRQFVIEALDRNEFLGKNWDKRYPDLAQQRRELIARHPNWPETEELS